jgi:hypothetical protein
MQRSDNQTGAARERDQQGKEANVKRANVKGLLLFTAAVVGSAAGTYGIVQLQRDNDALRARLEDTVKRYNVLAVACPGEAERCRKSIETVDELTTKVEECDGLLLEEQKRAKFWYQWQHAKNGPQCARALRLMEVYERDAEVCSSGTPEQGFKQVPSLNWWCHERQQKIQEDTNKVELGNL